MEMFTFHAWRTVTGLETQHLKLLAGTSCIMYDMQGPEPNIEVVLFVFPISRNMSVCFGCYFVQIPCIRVEIARLLDWFLG